MQVVAQTTAACRRCGGTVGLTYETLPYIAVGPSVAELRNVTVLGVRAYGH